MAVAAETETAALAEAAETETVGRVAIVATGLLAATTSKQDALR